MNNSLHKILLLLFTILCSLTTLTAQINHSIHFEASDYDFVINHEGKVFIKSKNIHTYYGESNQPCLPFTNLSLAIPYGSKASSVEIHKSDRQLIKENVSLTNSPNEEYNQSAENIPLTFDSETTDFNRLLCTNFWGCLPIAHIQLSPFEYDSESGDLYFISDFSITMNLERYSIEHLPIEDIEDLTNQLSILVHNPEALTDIICQIPTSADASNLTVGYLIITSTNLAESFSSILDWKRKKGLSCYIETIEDIAKNYEGSDLPEKIKRCIYYYFKNNKVKYVVLGGDDTVVPVRYCQLKTGYAEPEEIYPTDLYYSCFINNFEWNANEDEYYGCLDGDNASVFSDVFLTRLPVRTCEHVANFATKLLAYERCYNYGGWNFNILQTGALLSRDNRKDTSEAGRLKSDAESYADMIYDGYIAPYWKGGRIKFFDTFTDFNGGADYPLHQDNLQSQLEHSPMFVSMITHGSFNCWGMEDWHEFLYDEKGNFLKDENGDKIELQNYDYLYTREYAKDLVAENYTLITTTSCDSNMFDEEAAGIPNTIMDDPCLSEVFIREKNNGIIGYVGSSRAGIHSSWIPLSYSQLYEALFYQTLLTNKQKNLGRVVATSKISMSIKDLLGDTQAYYKIIYPVNPMGDAEMPIFTEYPREFEDLCIYGGFGNLTIESGTDDALISITDNQNVLEPILAQGSLTTFPPYDATIYITKQNYKPMVYHVITSDRVMDFYQELPLKEGFKEVHVAQLYNDMYMHMPVGEGDIANALIISETNCQGGILKVKLEGSLQPNSVYTLSLRNLVGTDSYTTTVSSKFLDVDISSLNNGMYALVLCVNGVEIDSRKICIM